MYRTAVLSLAGLMVGLGAVLIVESVVVGGALGLLLGALFVAAGALRIWLARRRPR
jgi:hypothetical protein